MIVFNYFIFFYFMIIFLYLNDFYRYELHDLHLLHYIEFGIKIINYIFYLYIYKIIYIYIFIIIERSHLILEMIWWRKEIDEYLVIKICFNINIKLIKNAISINTLFLNYNKYKINNIINNNLIKKDMFDINIFLFLSINKYKNIDEHIDILFKHNTIHFKLLDNKRYNNFEYKIN